MTELRAAEWRDLPVTWSYTDSSEQVAKRRKVVVMPAMTTGLNAEHGGAGTSIPRVTARDTVM